MREIKFRAWDSLCKSMLTHEDLVEWLPDGGGSLIQQALYGAISVDLMQYTGLKDKNGVEIYEGDIVNIVWPTTIKKLYVVEMFQRGDSGFPQWQFSDPENRRNYCGSSGGNVVVIGNIYKSPELLEVDSE